MSDDSQQSTERAGDELKLALAAAFGDDAIDLLAQAENDCDVTVNRVEQSSHDRDQPQSRIEWMHQLTQAIYADRLESEKRSGSEYRDPRFLVFDIGSTRFAAGLSNIRHVQRKPRITRLPRTPSWLRGVTNYRGEIISVTDLRNLLELEGDRPNDGEKVIIIQDHVSGLSTGLTADHVLGIRATDQSGNPLRPSNKLAEVADQIVSLDDQPTYLINATQLFQSKRLADFSA